MSQDLAKAAADSGIRNFLISFVDLFGVLRAKLVRRGQTLRDGRAFAGFYPSRRDPTRSDMFACGPGQPDPASKPEIGWLAADLHLNGKPVEHARAMC
jgi:glutamine synthetase